LLRHGRPPHRPPHERRKSLDLIHNIFGGGGPTGQTTVGSTDPVKDSRTNTTTTSNPADDALNKAQAHAQQLADLEEQRSNRARISAIQKQLLLETATAGRGYGLKSLFGSLGAPRNSVLGSG
jgi:hypothetical protein